MAYTTIDDPSAHFQVDIHTGDGSGSTETFDGNSDLQPDLLWFKSRSISGDHGIVDTSRGKPNSSFYILKSNSTAGDVTVNSGSDFTSMNSDGYTYGSSHHLDLASNTSQNVVWGWKANGGTRSTFTESGNNMGGGYQVNATAGFSIVDYVGTGSAGYFSHGLGAAPEFIIIKNRSYAGNWRVWHHKMSGVTYRASLNTTDAESSGWDSWTVGSSTVTLGTDGSVNRDGDNHIAYCFRSIKGYSKFGKYVGNGAEPDGPFIYTGFSPAFIMVKAYSEAGQGYIIGDHKRDSYNMALEKLFPNVSAASSGATGDNNWDFLSNGFKIRTQDAGMNWDGRSFFYAAFAHQPFVTSTGIPATAR